ncbi:PAS domain-containing protein [bacterium]|nr:PAS domain-containing protein [candidate division CSSED10-310 bacterium]
MTNDTRNQPDRTISFPTPIVRWVGLPAAALTASVMVVTEVVGWQLAVAIPAGLAMLLMAVCQMRKGRVFTWTVLVFLSAAVVTGGQVYRGMMTRRIEVEFMARAESTVLAAVDDALALPERLPLAVAPVAQRLADCVARDWDDGLSCRGLEHCGKLAGEIRLPIGQGEVRLPPAATGVIDATGRVVAWTGDLTWEDGAEVIPGVASGGVFGAISGFVRAGPDDELVYRGVTAVEADAAPLWVVVEMVVGSLETGRVGVAAGAMAKALEFWYPGIHVEMRTLLKPGAEDLPVAVEVPGIPAETEAVVPVLPGVAFWVTRVSALPRAAFVERNVRLLKMVSLLLMLAIWLIIAGMWFTAHLVRHESTDRLRHLAAAVIIVIGARMAITLPWSRLTRFEVTPPFLDPAFFGSTIPLFTDALAFFITAILGCIIVQVVLLAGRRGSRATHRWHWYHLFLFILWQPVFQYCLGFLVHNSSASWWWPHLERLDSAPICMQLGCLVLGLVPVLILWRLGESMRRRGIGWISPALGLFLVTLSPPAARWLVSGEPPWRFPWISLYEGLAPMLVCLGVGLIPAHSKPVRGRIAAVFILVLAAAAMVYPSLHHVAWMNRRALTEELIRQAANERVFVGELALTDALEESAVAAGIEDGEVIERMASELWRQSNLGVLELPSAVSVWRDGELLSRCCFGLPAHLTLPVERRLLIAAGDLQQDDVVYRGRPLTVAAGRRLLPNGDLLTIAVPLYPRLLIHSSTFTPMQSPYESAQMAGMVLTEYREDKILNAYGGEPVPYLGGHGWMTVDLGARGEQAVFYTPTGTAVRGVEALSVALPRPTILQHVKGYVEFLLQGIPLVFLLLALSSRLSLAIPSFEKGVIPASHGELPFRVRFILAFLLIGVAPLAALSISFDGITRRSIAGVFDAQAGELSAGVRSLVQETSTPIEQDWGREFQGDAFNAGLVPVDELRAWTGCDVPVAILQEIQRVYGGEINVYLDGRLAATTRPDYFASNLMKYRLPGWVKDQLIQGRSQVWNLVDLDGIRTRIVYVPVRCPDGHLAAVFSLMQPLSMDPSGLPLPGREGLFLVLAFGTIIVLVVLSYWFSGMISRPIEMLVDGTRHVMEPGDRTPVDGDLPGEFRYLARAFNLMAADIRRQQLSLEKRREFIETLIGGLSSGVIAWNQTGVITFINKAAQGILGIRMVSGSRTSLRTLLADVGRGSLLELMDEVQVGATDEREEQLGLVLDDRVVTVRVLFTRLRDQEARPEGGLMVFEDLSELIRSSKLDAWTDMARRVAHEIKNPLTPIQLAIEHLRQLYNEGSAQFDDHFPRLTELILEQVEGLRTIASEFSRYAKLPVPKPAPVEIPAMIEETLELLRPSLPGKVNVRFEHDETIGEAQLDRDLIQRALLNIMQNAVEAMPGGGELTVTAGMAAGGRRFYISVTDTGVGIPESQMVRLFEPYFSTRKEGSGLGLAIAKKTVTDHGGEITVRSEPGRGSTFSIFLPF